MKARLERWRARPARYVLLGALVYAVLVGPYVFNSSLQATATGVSTLPVDSSQLPQVVGLYLNGGEQYYLSIVRTQAGSETWAVVSTKQIPSGSLAYLGTIIAEWSVQPYSMSIEGHQGFDRLVVAGSVSLVPYTTATVETWLQSWGKAIVDVSTLIAFAAPVLSIAVAWYLFKRIPLWLIVGVAWVYAAQFLAIDLVGSGYGLYPSFTLLVAVVLLIPVAYVVDMLEAAVRERLARTSHPPQG